MMRCDMPQARAAPRERQNPAGARQGADARPVVGMVFVGVNNQTDILRKGSNHENEDKRARAARQRAGGQPELACGGRELSRRRRAFIPQLVNSSTIPANGDLNPYGVAFVPEGFASGGTLSTGDVLVSNFNNSANAQGLGTTIIQLTPRGTLAPPGAAATFFSSSLPGLSTALGVLRRGFVVVGNVPTTDGTFNTIGQGALQVIDRHGTAIHTWTDPVFLDGPWDLALADHGAQAHIFVSNVLNGTVSRLDVAVGQAGVTLLKKENDRSGLHARAECRGSDAGPYRAGLRRGARYALRSLHGR